LAQGLFSPVTGYGELPGSRDGERLGYFNPHSLKEGMEALRPTDVMGSRLGAQSPPTG